MARNRKRSGTTIQKCLRSIDLSIPPAPGIATEFHYVDMMEQLSKVNRKLFRQGKDLAIQSCEFLFASDSDPTAEPPVEASFDSIQISIQTAGDTWPVHNGWVKGKALHSEMQALVTDDNPSIKGTWADFKVYLDEEHYNSPNILQAVDGAFAPVNFGRWDYSTFVLPQHDVQIAGPDAGEPEPADETFAHLVGPNAGVAGAFASVSLVKAYQESRATVQPTDPSVPAGMSESFFNLLTDSGSQEPELADVIEGENDAPPYDQDQYPGGAFNAPSPWLTVFTVSNVYSPVGLMNGFVAQCGLIKIGVVARLGGKIVPAPQILFKINVAPGFYKGVAAIDMGQ